MFKSVLASEFAPYGALSNAQLDQLEAHYRALSRWNERLNLTRIRDFMETIKFHYCESLFLAIFIPPDACTIVDVGSGAGFPGIPVAITRPDCQITLVESHQRKAVFLREATRDLNNVTVIPARAKDVTGEFDWLISRAVSPMEVLALKLAGDVALLIGKDDSDSLKGYQVPIPWGKQRVLFHVKRQSGRNS